MTHSIGLVFHLESLGVQLRAAGSDIHFRAPGGVLTHELRGLVRANKAELLTMFEARRKFGHRHAALFQLIGQSVITPQGRGELLSVSRNYCRVALHRTGAVVLHRPAELIALRAAEDI